MSNYRYYAASRLSKKDCQHINDMFTLSINEPNPKSFIYNLELDIGYLVNHSFSDENDLEIKFFPNLKALIEGIYIHRLNKLIGV